MFRTMDGPATVREVIDAVSKMLPAGTDMFG
jgi:hypothetical protein